MDILLLTSSYSQLHNTQILLHIYIYGTTFLHVTIDGCVHRTVCKSKLRLEFECTIDMRIFVCAHSQIVQRSVFKLVTSRANRIGRESVESRRYCMYYNRFGRCSRGSECKFIHDPDKVSVCTRYDVITLGVTVRLVSICYFV
jgi:hypothetical protein